MWTNHHLIKTRDNFYKKTFTFSLSNKGDSIPMWNYYSDKSGISIGFNRELLCQQIKTNTLNYYSFFPCNIEYEESRQIQVIKEKLNEILAVANKPEFMHDDIKKTLFEIDKVMSFMWCDSNMYKNNNFHYEEEYRLTLCKLDVNKKNEIIDKHHYIVSEHNIKPIIKISVADIWDDLITDIVVSPFNQSRNILDTVQDFLQDNSISINEEKIIKSACLVRNL